MLQCNNTSPVETDVEKFLGETGKDVTTGMFKSETSMFGNTFIPKTRHLNIDAVGGMR